MLRKEPNRMEGQLSKKEGRGSVMSDFTWKEKLESYGLQQVLGYLDRDPDTNIPKVIDWVERLGRVSGVAELVPVVKKAVEDKDGNWYQLVESLYTDIDPAVRKKLFEVFLIHSAAIGVKRQKKSSEKYGCNVPWAILMDPTSACNLHCTGCWAAEYGNQLNLDFDTLDRIITQGKELGTFMYIYTGGEPLIRKKDLIRLCEVHSDCAFLSFTNGTLIDNDFADELLRVKNFVPAISVEGFEEETDFRRGEGTYQSVIRAMKILKERKLPFGISCCYTSKNYETIGSEAYFDQMIEMGAKFAWFFTYMPVGIDAVPELMVTDQQREYMYHQVRKFRSTKPIFTMDFWNDGEYVNGCIAGGRCYLHINANGDIEPCAFIHYSDSNISEKTLLEAYRSPMFMQYRQNQPFSDNFLRPCPLLDVNGALAKMVKASGAKSTDLAHPEDVEELCAKCAEVAVHWEKTANRLWEKTLERKNCKKTE